MILDPGLVQERDDLLVKILLVDLVDLGGDLERKAEAPGDLYRAIRPFLRGDAAEKCEVTPPRMVAGLEQTGWQAMMDGGDKIAAGNRLALVIGDGDERHLAKAEIERLEIGQILSAVERGEGTLRHGAEQREVKLVDVEMENIELVGALPHPIEHKHVIGNGVAHVRVEPQRHGGARNEAGARYRVAACKQRHVVTEPDQLVGQIGHDPLRAAVKTRRHALHERRDLRNFHRGQIPLRQDPTLAGQRPALQKVPCLVWRFRSPQHSRGESELQDF